VPAEAAKIVSQQEDFTIPVDKKGLVIYFSVNGKGFFFNGHNGFFVDSLPEFAQQAFAALALPVRQRRRIYKSLKSQYGQACQNLIKEIELFQNGTHPDLAPEPRQKRFHSPMLPSAISVYISQGCNLACSYCFNQRGSLGQKPSFMSEATAREVLGFISHIVKSEAHPVITVFLYGGEPMLNPGATFLLARGLQDLNHRNLKTKVHPILSTNGTIYNQEIFDIFAEFPEFSTVIVSLDAFKEVHDRNRPFANQKKGSSFDCVKGNLKRMAREKIPHSATCIVPFPYDFVGAAEALHCLPAECVEIKELNHYILGKTVLPEVFEQDFDTWRQNYIEYADYYIEYLNSKNPVRHVDRYNLPGNYALRLAEPKEPDTTLACRVADASLAIDAVGNLIPCEAFLGQNRFYLGDVKKGFNQAKYARFEKWILSKGQFRIDSARCKYCFAQRLCGGGCYAASFNETGKLEALGENACAYVREAVKINLYFISQFKNRQPGIFSQLKGAAVE